MNEDLEEKESAYYIKNMVCDRCIMAVNQVFQSVGIKPRSILLGKAVISKPLTNEQKLEIENALKQLGFELLDDNRLKEIEQIKNLVVDMVHYHPEKLRFNVSVYLAEEMHRDYSSLSKLFSEVTGTTIEKYLIAQKIEKAKELLAYNQMTLAEIADRLNYSSPAYFSSQFKNITGMTPGAFRQMNEKPRLPLDQV